MLIGINVPIPMLILINSANDINGVAGIPPDGDYIVKVTRPDGTYDTYSNIHLGV